MYSIPRILFFYFLFPPCLSLLFRPMLSILSPVLVLVIHSLRSFILALSIPPGLPVIRASSPMETKNMEHLILFLFSIPFHSIPIFILYLRMATARKTIHARPRHLGKIHNRPRFDGVFDAVTITVYYWKNYQAYLVLIGDKVLLSLVSMKSKKLL